MTHTLRYAARTDRGLLRANNQDSVYAGNRLLVVADGMGGHAAGDTASRLAVAAFAPLDDYQPGGRDLLTPLEHATDDGNEAIADMVAENPDLEGMGTTVTALLFDGTRLGIAHVGDSRAYLWRAGVLSQITHDDTFVQSLIDEGRITEAEAAIHPQRSLLLRAINGSDVEPSLINREVRVGDRYLICSDGLTGVISAEAIADTLASYDTSDAADRLIELALRGGGPDNVTVVVADVVDTGEGPDPDADPPTPLDADATGPMESMRFTRRMPRVPLPKEPDVTELAARAQAQQALADPDDEEFGDEADSDDAPLDAEQIGTGHPRTRKWLRRAGYLVVVVALLVIGGVLGVQWVGNQYYVGDDNGTVTIFRGVDGSVFGLRLSSAQESSCDAAATECVSLRTDDLVQAARDQVLTGIPANDLQNAREIVVRLRLQQLPLCSSLAPPVTGGPTTPSGVTATSTPTGTAAGTTTGSTVGAGPLGDPTRTTTATPLTAGTSTQSAAGTAVAGSTGATVSGTVDTRLATTGDTGPASTTSVAPGTTLAAEPAEPGVNCRIVR